MFGLPRGFLVDDMQHRREAILDVKVGFALGAIDYITKPIQSEEVLVRLKTHLTIRDLQRDLENKNTRLQQEIIEREKLIAELDSFAHTVAHNLKGPLMPIIGNAELLKMFHTTTPPEKLLHGLEALRLGLGAGAPRRDAGCPGRSRHPATRRRLPHH